MYPFEAGRVLLLRFSAALLMLAAFGQLVEAQSNPAVRAATAPTPDLDELLAVSAGSTMNDSGPEGIIPATRGFNASLGTSSQHDSANGWSSILTPNMAYRFNRYFSVDAGVPLYGYVKVYSNVGTAAKPVYAYNTRSGAFGDLSLSFDVDTSFASIGYSATVSLGLPSGNTNYGLGAGQVTYSINNHFEKDFGRFTPDIEMGIGDTTSLVDQRVLKSYVAVGPMAHFQAGTTVSLPWSLSFEADAYEELPLAKNLVYSTTGKGKKKVTTSTNEDPAEDNGFISSLDIPLSPHVTLSGFYNRSLRDHDDVGGFSFTFLLKPPARVVETEH